MRTCVFFFNLFSKSFRGSIFHEFLVLLGGSMLNFHEFPVFECSSILCGVLKFWGPWNMIAFHVKLKRDDTHAANQAELSGRWRASFKLLTSIRWKTHQNLQNMGFGDTRGLPLLVSTSLLYPSLQQSPLAYR